MRARPGREGLEGLPLKLAITAIVVAISSPIIYGGLRSYEAARLEGQLGSEAQAIAEIAKMLYIGGPGNAQGLKVDIGGGVTASADYMVVGDIPGGAYESCIRYRVKGMAEQTLLVEGPNVPMRGPMNEALKLLGGHHTLMLSCKTDGGDAYVDVSVQT